MNREEQNKNSRKKILEASLQEFGEKDYTSASINNICKNNNISKGMLFHYYKNKDEIFLLCVEKLFIDLSNYLKDNFKVLHSNMEDNFRDFIQKRFTFFHQYPYYEQIFYSSTFNPPKHLIYEINLLRKPIDETNKEFWCEIIGHLNLKADIIIDDVIDMIIGIGNHLHIKIQQNNIQYMDGESWVVEKYTTEYVKMINMLLFGIID